MIKITKKWSIALSIVAVCGICFIAWQAIIKIVPQKTIRVGILHSLSGSLAISERPVSQATLLAIQEINAAGGILGRQIEPLLVDGKSDDDTFATEAKRLVTENKVAAILDVGHHQAE